MALPLRITFNDKDYVYQILNIKQIDQNVTELSLMLNGENLEIVQDIKRVWVQKNEVKSVDPDLVQALGRSVSLRLRM